MKTAYELAMERLRSEEPDHAPISESQKERLTEVETRFKAKMAERDIHLRGQLQTARNHGDLKAISKIESQIRAERDRLSREMEAEKEKIRNTDSG